jgi:hypothetical protein
MLKPGSNFKLSKQTKRFMATYINAEARNSFKRDMIQAELYSQQQPPRREKSDRNGGSRGTTTDSSWTSTDAWLISSVSI